MTWLTKDDDGVYFLCAHQFNSPRALSLVCGVQNMETFTCEVFTVYTPETPAALAPPGLHTTAREPKT